MNTLTNEQSKVQVREQQLYDDLLDEVAELQDKLMHEHNLTCEQASVAAIALLDQQEKRPYVNFLVGMTKLHMGI